MTALSHFSKTFLMPSGFTGIDQAYEAPDQADLVVRTVGKSIQESVMEVIEMLEKYVSHARDICKLMQ